jgi:hypothetical protein
VIVNCDPAIVGRYGKFVELWATDRYPLTLDYPVVDGLKFDASGEDGRPWDVKGSMINASDRRSISGRTSTRRWRTLTAGMRLCGIGRKGET